jgi:hypothetical protein
VVLVGAVVPEARYAPALPAAATPLSVTETRETPSTRRAIVVPVIASCSS